MNVYQGKQNVGIGQFQEFGIKLDDSLVFRFSDNSIIIQDDSGNPQMQFVIEGGLLKFQLWDGNQFAPSQTITNPAVSSEDSTVLPHNPANTYLSIDQYGFKVFFNTIEKLLYINQDLNVQMQNFNIDNGLSDFVMKIQTELGQQFFIRDYNTDANLLNISTTSVNVYNKQIKGVQAGTSDTDAVTLFQLKGLTPNVMQIKLPDTQLHFRNSLQQDLVNIDNSRMFSNVALTYDQPKPITNNNQVPAWQTILDYLTGYQGKTEKNQINGYAGLDQSGKLNIDIERLETLRVNQNRIKAYGTTPITTDFLDEGTVNQYYNEQRVIDAINTQKGISNGIPNLDVNGLIPSAQIPPLQVGSTFSGLLVDKSNPAHYQGSTPIAGDRYIATDAGSQYILTNVPYTNDTNWIELMSGGVDSVNGQTGVVSLNTDNVQEGQEKYFQSGIVDYKTNDANQANELLLLDGNGLLNTQQIPNILRLNQGAIQLTDNQLDRVQFQNPLNNNNILTIQKTQVVANVPMRNNNLPIIDSNQFTDKNYVDTAIQTLQPEGISTNDTSVLTNQNNIETRINNFLIRQEEQAQTTYNTPIIYNSLVPITEDQQLTTKLYVDTLLSDFVSNSGVAKEFIQTISNVSVNQNSKITGWNANVVSQTQQRIQLTNSDTFNVVAGVYRIYIGIKIKEFMNTGLVNVSVIVRDSNTLNEYMVFDFTTIVNADGGNQEFTIAQPYLWRLDNPATIEVYAQIGNVQYNIYESYFMIEEVEKYGIELGRDKITDPTLSSTLRITNQYLDFNIDNSEYGRMQNDLLSLNSGIKVQYDPATFITDNRDLVTKKYVDERVSNSLISVTDLGQMFQAGLSINQTNFLTSNNQVRFNTQVINTSYTITMDTLGNITFTPGFVYQIAVSISIQFSQATGFAIFSFKRSSDQQSVVGSKLYMVTQPSSNTQQTSIVFFVDLRSELASQTYTLNIDSSLNLGTVYSQYTRITCEQKQIINQQYWDRIQNLGAHSQIQVVEQGVQYKIDDENIELTENNDGSVQRTLLVNNKDFEFKSTTASQDIKQLLENTNVSNANQRTSTQQVQINGQNKGFIQSIISDQGSNNNKTVIFGSTGADKTQLAHGIETSINMQDNSIQYSINNNEVYSQVADGDNHKIVLVHENADLYTQSANDSVFINNTLLLANTDNNQYRESNLITNVNNQVSGFIKTNIDVLAQNNTKQVVIGSDNANQTIFTNDRQTELKLDNQSINTQINNLSVNTTTRDNNNLINTLQQSNAISVLRSSDDAYTIESKTLLNNTEPFNLRQSLIYTSVNDEASTLLGTVIQNQGSGGLKESVIGGVNTDRLYICSTNPLQPEVIISAPSQSQSIPIQMQTKTGYAPGITIDQDNQFVTKKYVEDTIVSQLPALNDLNPPNGDVDLNTYKLINVGNASNDGDALNRVTADNRYYRQTATLDQIQNPIQNVSMNSRKLTNLANPTLATDAVNKTYVDTNALSIANGDLRYYLNTTTLDNIQPPQLGVNMNTKRITTLGDALDATDALNRQTADARYYQNTTTLNDISLANGNVSLNNNKITNLANPTLSTDAVSKSYLESNTINQTSADSRYYQNTTTLNNITAPSGNVSINNNKLTNVSTPDSNNDAANKLYVDTNSISQTNADARYYQNTTTLNNITVPDNSVSLANNKITNLGNATLATDALNRQTADARYYQSSVTLNNVTAPNGDLSLNTNKITNLTDPTLPSDAASKNYVDTYAITQIQADSRYYLNTVALSSITAPSASLSLNNQKITNLADATLATDALNRQTGDGRYYANTVPLSSITAPSASLSLNNQKITNLADATLSTDALNRQTGDSRYYLNSVVLSSITAPTSSLSLNSQKITNLADATLATDALNMQTGDSRYYRSNLALNSLTAPSGSLSLNSQKIINLATPTLTSDAATKAYVDTATANVSLTIAAFQQYIRRGTLLTVGISESAYEVPSSSVSGCITSANIRNFNAGLSSSFLIRYNLPFIPIISCSTTHLSSSSGSSNGSKFEMHAFTQPTSTEARLLMYAANTNSMINVQWRIDVIFVNPAIA